MGIEEGRLPQPRSAFLQKPTVRKCYVKLKKNFAQWCAESPGPISFAAFIHYSVWYRSNTALSNSESCLRKKTSEEIGEFQSKNLLLSWGHKVYDWENYNESSESFGSVERLFSQVRSITMNGSGGDIVENIWRDADRLVDLEQSYFRHGQCRTA